MTYNLIMDTDGYKLSQYRQIPSDTQIISAYGEARVGKEEIVQFGLQPLLKKWESNPITKEMIAEAESYFVPYGAPFNKAGWEYIVEAHGGMLPLEICAVPEGTVLPGNNVMFQVRNTDPNVPWLTTYVETSLLRAAWYGSTVATLSRDLKKIIGSYLDDTSDNLQVLDYMLHDFGSRGVSSRESAGLGGCAHLVNFKGTDTIEALRVACESYHAMDAGQTIPASEHSTITAWGREWESAAYSNMISQFGRDGGSFSIVLDAYDLDNAVENIIGKELKADVEKLKGCLVCRPDSGSPEVVVSNTIRLLMDSFGYSLNSKGFKVLPPYLRVIQGDGVDLVSLVGILSTLKDEGISTENVSFGMGGHLLQGVMRDDHRWAVKGSAICRNGKWSDMYKEPKTDLSKASKRGRLALINEGGTWSTIRQENLGGRRDQLVPVFLDGKTVNTWTLEGIRSRAAV